MDVEGCPLPEDRWYDFENSTWTLPDPSDGGSWTLGLTASLVAFAGRFASVTFRALEGAQPRGRSVATVESLRYTGPVRLPLEGTVVEVNGELPGNPRLLNDAPYGRGWIVRWRPRDPTAPARQLEPAGAIAERLRARIREMRIRCFPVTPDRELIALGSECSATLARLDEELARMAPNEVIHLVTDDPTSPIEMVRWSDQSGQPILAERVEENLHHFLVRREPTPTARRRRAADGRIL